MKRFLLDTLALLPPVWRLEVLHYHLCTNLFLLIYNKLLITAQRALHTRRTTIERTKNEKCWEYLFLLRHKGVLLNWSFWKPCNFEFPCILQSERKEQLVFVGYWLARVFFEDQLFSRKHGHDYLSCYRSIPILQQLIPHLSHPESTNYNDWKMIDNNI